MNLETFDKRSVNQRKTSPLRKSTKGEYSAETGRPISPERAKLKVQEHQKWDYHATMYDSIELIVSAQARLNTPLGVATPLGAPSQNLVKVSHLKGPICRQGQYLGCTWPMGTQQKAMITGDDHRDEYGKGLRGLGAAGVRGPLARVAGGAQTEDSYTSDVQREGAWDAEWAFVPPFLHVPRYRPARGQSRVRDLSTWCHAARGPGRHRGTDRG